MQDLSLCRLWIAKIHHLVQQFVYDYEVVPYALLLELFEILGKDLDNLVEEEKYLGCVGVAFSEREKVEVVVTDI